MKAVPFILTFAITLLATVFTLRWLDPPSSEAGERSSAAAELAPLKAELAALRSELEDLRKERGRDLPAVLPAPSSRTPVVDIEAAVRKVLAELEAEGAAVPEPLHEDGELTVDSLLAELQAIGGDPEQAGPIWERARKAGLADELLAWFVENAENNPHDAGAQMAVGNAYLQKIFEVGEGPEAGKWAMAADGAFDRALEIDPDHWDARFTKAISLSFWPPIFGKQQEAIRQFEILIEKQAALPRTSNQAQAYVLLGNLYSQSGQADKAAEVWQNGAALFPDDPALQEQLGGGN